ncbi:MAG: response regulator [Candidatus Muirbacterium halophilum]|nr:response regulator [Candidatus Muirbacterium halophilum]MCK9477396.1 response regulator [Candidatus Muirbacterium halophilum]
MKILIVDDCEIQIELMKRYFSVFKENISQVHFALNGEDAIDIIKNNTIDTLITDLNMPVMDGLTLIRSVIKEDYNQNMRIIVMSAELEYNNFTDFELPHISGFIEKPFSIKQLIKLIHM